MRGETMRNLLLGLALSGVLLAGAATTAATQPTGAPSAAQPAAPAAPAADAAPEQAAALPLRNETRALRGRLEALKAELAQKDAALGRDLRDQDLQRIRQETEPLWQSIRDIIDELQPRLDAAKARLDQLGPRPKEDAPEESADVPRDRAEREAAVGELDETLRLARALLVQAEQITTQIERPAPRRLRPLAPAAHLGDLESRSLVRGGASLPRDAAALGSSSRAGPTGSRQGDARHAVLLGLALGVAIALYAGRRHVAPRLVPRDPARRRRAAGPPPRGHGACSSGRLPALAGSYLVYLVLDTTSLIVPRVERVVAALLGGLAFVAFVHALADAILAPGGPAGGSSRLPMAAAARITNFLVGLAAIIVVGKVFEALNQAIAAALPITVATKACLRFSRRSRSPSSCAVSQRRMKPRRNASAPTCRRHADIGGPVRMLGWASVAAVDRQRARRLRRLRIASSSTSSSGSARS